MLSNHTPNILFAQPRDKGLKKQQQTYTEQTNKCSAQSTLFFDLTPIYRQFYTESILLGMNRLVSEVGVQLEGFVEYELLHLVFRQRVLLEVEGEGVRADGLVGDVVKPL